MTLTRWSNRWVFCSVNMHIKTRFLKVMRKNPHSVICVSPPPITTPKLISCPFYIKYMYMYMYISLINGRHLHLHLHVGCMSSTGLLHVPWITSHTAYTPAELVDNLSLIIHYKYPGHFNDISMTFCSFKTFWLITSLITYYQ